MHPYDCPGWEYEHHPSRSNVIDEIKRIVTGLGSGHIETRSLIVDSRAVHQTVFQTVTPTDCEYYAGHYRGEAFRCLRHYAVTIPSDPRVGAPAYSVDYLMRELASVIGVGLLALDADDSLSVNEKLRYIVTLACRVFVAFLTIHPYANGNGHAGRLIVWCVLGRYGHWPKHWSVDPKPPDPPYSALIKLYRDGQTEPLEKYILQTLIP